MMKASREAGFDILLAEALDRLSRDQEDIAVLYKRLKFRGVRRVTVSEGDISELHIGLKGTMNAIYLKDLGEKTHRGLRGRVIAGTSAGGLCYGYQVVRAIGANGEPVRGDRKVHELEAPMINRIFKMFSDGNSPIAIAKTLNQEGVLGPRGTPGGIRHRGHAGRGTGILRNETYAGRRIWNCMHYIKDPNGGRNIYFRAKSFARVAAIQ